MTKKPQSGSNESDPVEVEHTEAIEDGSTARDSPPSESDGQAPDPALTSGLRNPQKAARGLAAATLSLEALAVLMAIAPMRMLLEDSGPAIVALLVLFVGCVVLAGMVRKSWIWQAGMALQVAFIACFVFHPSLGVGGVIFAATWAYCWNIARDLSRPPRRDKSNPNYAGDDPPRATG
ncbi:DUF4233 domain-containing protein [Natronoglycomyces albus]|uniref:DUF4233 domain-containing protein n=1 Tax=Natronoglycomyces albus TaxID=2811108 RepID=A0A895XWH8_9ACTN|nr:DUF4233 domain-containing protein [Natronoglycomyces albus]QSB05988.1 DUF4233 domain-containing protein [Natronoglycomyces albus]